MRHSAQWLTGGWKGELAKGDVVYNQSNGKKIKVPRLVQMHSNEMSDITSVTNSLLSAADDSAVVGRTG